VTTGAFARCSLWAVICVSATVVGCATPAGFNPASGLQSAWTKFSAKQTQKSSPADHNRLFSPADRKLKDPAKLNLAYARLTEEQGDAAEARRRYELVLGEKPKSVDAILGLARLDQLAGHSHEAEQEFKQALRLQPNDPGVQHAIGQFYVSQQRWKEAIKSLNSAMMAAPNEPTYRYHLAVALARSGDLSGAMPHFTKTVGNAQAHYNIGYILYQQGHLDSAEQHFMQAVIKKPDLQQAQKMLNLVRREREDRLMLAGASVSQPASSNSSPSPHSVPFQSNDLAPYQAPRPQAVPSGVVNPTHFQPASRPNGQSAALNGQLPGLQLRGDQPVYSGHSLGRPTGPQQQIAAPREPAGAQPQVPSGTTPQQFEQWKNQLRGLTTDN